MSWAEIGCDAPQVGGGQDLDREPMRALDRGLALDVRAAARSSVGHHQPAAAARPRDRRRAPRSSPAHSPIEAMHQRNRRREAAGPGLALLEERLERDLGVDAAGVGAGRQRVDLAALDQQRRRPRRGPDSRRWRCRRGRRRRPGRRSRIRSARRPGFGLPAAAAATYRPCRASKSGSLRVMAQQFRGSYTVTITPFTEDGKAIDIPAWTRFLDWQLAEGVPGIIILGTTGEFLTLTDDERQRVRRGDRQARRRAHPGLVGTMNAYTPQRRALQPRGGGAGRRRADDHPALLLHADRGRDLRLLQGDLRDGLDPDHALQQPLHLQRRHVGEAGRPADRAPSSRSATSRRRARTWPASTTSSRRPRAS